MQITGWAVPPEQNPTEVQEPCLELCLELLSLGLAPRPLHARGQQGESSPRAAPVGCAGAGGFCSPVGCLFGSSSRVKIQPRWYFQFVFLRGGADAIGCSRSPSVTSGFFILFFFFLMEFVPGWSSQHTKFLCISWKISIRVEAVSVPAGGKASSLSPRYTLQNSHRMSSQETASDFCCSQDVSARPGGPGERGVFCHK